MHQNKIIRWKKSSFSGGEGTQCVELAHTLVAVRDSKNSAGPMLAVDLTGLLGAVKGGRLTR